MKRVIDNAPVKFLLRIDPRVHQKLKACAQHNRRSLNSEINAQLDGHLSFSLLTQHELELLRLFRTVIEASQDSIDNKGL